MPVGTPFHARTLALSRSLGYREWAGRLAATSYEVHPEHEYNAVRQATALFDVSPLHKYRLRGRDALRLCDRVITRDASRLAVGRVFYTPWTDAAGHVLDDGTVQRLGENELRVTAAEPALRWLTVNATGLAVEIVDETDAVAALALQGPTSRDALAACVDGDLAGLRYFGVMRARIAGVAVEISRTGYTGDLGYEVFLPAEHALAVWDAVVAAGARFGLRPAGLHALDVARIEAGLVLQGVDYVGARRAETASQLYSPFELGFGRLVALGKAAPFVGRDALAGHAQHAPRRLCGLDLSWQDVERLHEEAGLAPQLPATASRTHVPVFRDGVQVGRASSTTWSPLLKKLIALASVPAASAAVGTSLDVEFTLDCRRRSVGARVVSLPFFDPPRKRS